MSTAEISAANANLSRTKSRHGDSPWFKGTVGNLRVEGSIYDEPSDYGIHSGRISKLWVSRDGVPVLTYDRGWDTYAVLDLHADEVAALVRAIEAAMAPTS